MKTLSLMHEFKEWLKYKYGWTYDYFCRMLGDSRQETIWMEFYRDRELKKHRG